MTLLKKFKRIAKQITPDKNGNLAKWYVVADKEVIDFILSQPTFEWEDGREWFGWQILFDVVEKEWYIWDHIAFQQELKNNVFTEIEWSKMHKILGDCVVDEESTPWKKYCQNFVATFDGLVEKDYPPYPTIEEDVEGYLTEFADTYKLTIDWDERGIFFDKWISTAEELFDKAVSALEKDYPDIYSTGEEMGDFPEDPDDEVEFSREYIFTAGKLFNEKLMAGGWIDYRHDRHDDEPSISLLMGVARNGDFKKGDIFKECEGLQGWYDIDTDTWSMEIGFY